LIPPCGHVALAFCVSCEEQGGMWEKNVKKQSRLIAINCLFVNRFRNYSAQIRK